MLRSRLVIPRNANGAELGLSFRAGITAESTFYSGGNSRIVGDNQDVAVTLWRKTLSADLNMLLLY